MIAIEGGLQSRSLILRQIEESVRVKQSILADESLIARIESVALACLESLRGKGKIIFAGNGGSFADAQHLSAEFISRFQIDRAPLASIALGTNNSTFSAIGNDYGYTEVFARELLGVGTSRDVFVAISASGNSANIIAAAEAARRSDIRTFGLTGADGGKLKSLCECIQVPSGDTARIQECHIMIGHIICGLVEYHYFR